MMDGNAFFFTKGEGGFYGQRFNIKLEDGRFLEDVGLWHRGEVPESIKHLFVKGNEHLIEEFQKEVDRRWEELQFRCSR